MMNLRKIEAELREAAEVGCDYTLLEKAADALNYAIKLIEFYANGGKTVYMKANINMPEEDLFALWKRLNRISPDKIILLPNYIDVLNPEELEKIRTKQCFEEKTC